MLLVISNKTVNAETINGAIRMALISSLREPVDKAIVEIYNDDKKAEELGLTWDLYDTGDP